ncbi:MAG: hypothetical protein E6833_13650 [Bradyrhizobium sp.]|nr:hypothetical protein [Bradyrhizobium sp.]
MQRVKDFAFVRRSPDLASFEDVRRYQLHLASRGAGVPTINKTVSTLRFFFKVTLWRHEIVEHTHVIHEPRKLPVVLSVEDVARLLDAAPGLKYKAALSVAYGAGLRANEVVSLKISHPAEPLNLSSRRIRTYGCVGGAESRDSPYPDRPSPGVPCAFSMPSGPSIASFGRRPPRDRARVCCLKRG